MFDSFGNEKSPGFNSLDARTAYKTDGDDSYERMLIQKKIRQHPFLEYACMHRHFHVRQISAAGEQDIIDQVCNFLCSSHHL